MCQIYARYWGDTGEKKIQNLGTIELTEQIKLQWWCHMVELQFIKDRFDKIGNKRKWSLEEGMIKQKSEEIAFK